MKSYYVVLSFTSGLGDFYTYVCEVYNIAKELKKRNHKIFLFVKCKEGIDFFKLFELDFYDTFDSVKVSNSFVDITELSNISCLYPENCNIENTHWCLFGEKLDDDIKIKHFNLISPSNLNFGNSDLSVKLSEPILKKTEIFLKENLIKDFCIVHFRLWDDMADVMNYSMNTNIIPEYFSVRGKIVKSDNILKEEILNEINSLTINYDKVILFSNSIYLKKYLKEKFSNLITLEENLNSYINRCYTDKYYLETCLIEFSMMSYAKKIFTFTDYSWITNFVSYGVLSHQEKNKLNPYLDDTLVENKYEFLNEVIT
jgi:hypothetical protein